jgi:hypothetical protein
MDASPRYRLAQPSCAWSCAIEVSWLNLKSVGGEGTWTVALRQGKAAHLRHPPTRIVESNADIEGVHFCEWTGRKQDLLECGGVDISDHVEDRRFQNRNSRDVPEYPGRLDWLTIMYIRQTTWIKQRQGKHVIGRKSSRFLFPDQDGQFRATRRKPVRLCARRGRLANPAKTM